jgi:site-specific DNA-methyltransferase (adenine-specific)
MARGGFTTMQPILYYGKDYRAGKGALPSGKAVTEASEKNGHPCPKPIGAWSWLLDKVSQEGETVVDPFMGSGTTLRAAKDLGRKAIGIEISEEYCEIAATRLSQEVLPLFCEND